MQGTIDMPGARSRGSKTTHGLNGHGQHQDVDRTPTKESIRMTEDRDKWRK